MLESLLQLASSKSNIISLSLLNSSCFIHTIEGPKDVLKGIVYGVLEGLNFCATATLCDVTVVTHPIGHFFVVPILARALYNSD